MTALPQKQRDEFFDLWRQRLRVTLPEFKTQIAKLGIFGTAAVSIAILADDPNVATSVITGLFGNFASNWVERWRSASEDDKRDALLAQLAREIEAHKHETLPQATFTELNLAASLHLVSDSIQDLQTLVAAKFATPQQITKIITGGGAYVGGNVEADAFVGRDQTIINLFVQSGTVVEDVIAQTNQPSRLSKWLRRVLPNEDQKAQRTHWENAAKRYLNLLEERYSSVRVLGKPQSISLEGTFTDAYVIEGSLASRRFDLNELEHHERRLDQLPHNVKRQNAVALVTKSQHKRLFVLGKPGAGKTTFLKYLALQAAQGRIERLPIFITLHEWSNSGKSLLGFICQQLEICNVPHPAIFIEQVLKAGKAMLLFDGLDEVNHANAKRATVIKAVKDFSDQYSNSQYDNVCLITCRNAASDYTFERFDYVEVADFTPEQVQNYASKWFADHPSKREAFIAALQQPSNKNIQELSNRPLLLTLLCLVFNDRMAFPKRQVGLYREALDALLKLWDSSRDIPKRDSSDASYKGLELERKEQLLSLIAAEMFDQNATVLMPREKLAAIIQQFWANLPAAERGECAPNSDDVLDEIEAQHGLLVERAAGIYSFSHLTFQEYFAAKYIHDHASTRLSALCQRDHVIDDRWREVFLMTSSLLSNADALFHHLQRQKQSWLQTHPKVRELVAWAHTQTTQIHAHRATGVMHLYIFITLDLAHTRGHNLKGDLAIDLILLACPLALDLARALDLALDLDLALALDLDFTLDLTRTRTFDHNLALALALTRTHDLDLTLTIQIFVYHIILISAIFQHILKNSSKNADYWNKYQALHFEGLQLLLKTQWAAAIQGWQRIQFPSLDADPTQWHEYHEQLRQFAAQHLGLRSDWQFDPEDGRAIKNLLQTNRLTLDCLELASVSDREAIKDGLLNGLS